jgi:ketosteroid isomerase-like protein
LKSIWRGARVPASQLEDKHAIEELIARYNQSLDGGDYAQWVACWADDAVLDGIGKLLTGKAQIQAFADQYESTTRSRINGLKHYTVNILSTVTGDKATSSSYLQLVSTTDKGVKIIFTGRYEDDLKRVNGQWQFARRKLHQDMPRQ